MSKMIYWNVSQVLKIHHVQDRPNFCPFALSNEGPHPVLNSAKDESTKPFRVFLSFILLL